MNRHTRHSLKIWAATGAVLLAAIGIAAVFWMKDPRFQNSKTVATGTDAISQSENSQIASGIAADLSSEAGTNGRVRRIFGHSLVPGGIHSIADLAIVTRRDPALAEHYQDFDLSQGRLVTLDRDILGFVSYRLDGAIYWQKRPALIAKGEQVLTDGSNVIRARCGNRIAESPHFPVSPAEPTDMDIVVGELTAPPDAPFDPSKAPSAPPEVSVNSAEPPANQSEAPGAPPSAGPGGPLLPTGPNPIWSGPLPPAPVPAPLPIPRRPPSPAFGGDEFSDVSVSILGHSRSIPTGPLTLLAGIVLVIVLRLVLSKS